VGLFVILVDDWEVTMIKLMPITVHGTGFRYEDKSRKELRSIAGDWQFELIKLYRERQAQEARIDRARSQLAMAVQAAKKR